MNKEMNEPLFLRGLGLVPRENLPLRRTSSIVDQIDDFTAQVLLFLESLDAQPLPAPRPKTAA